MKFSRFGAFLLLFCAIASADSRGTIKDISFSQSSTKYAIQIKGDGKLDCNTVLMDNPPRIALDFPNVKNNLYPNSYELKENSFAYRVKMSQYAKGADTISRVQVDLRLPLDYSVTQAKDGITLLLSMSPSQNRAPATITIRPAVPSVNPSTAAPSPSAPANTQPIKPSPPANTQPIKPSPSVPANPQPVPPSKVPLPEIVIGPEDLLEVAVFELPQFNVTSRVLGDGTISMPLVGNIEVRGLTKKQVEQKIAAALSKYVNNASVSVNVKEYKSRQVSLLGAVKSPGPYYMSSSRTLLQLLSEAGGLTTEAGNKCFVFRAGSPKIEINLFELMNSGNPDLNIAIYPGDVVNIPGQQKVVVYVLGAVKSPGAVELSTSLPITLLAAIAKAGGLDDSAKKSGITIKRRAENGAETVMKANLKDILNGKAQDVPLQPGDTINVPESFF